MEQTPKKYEYEMSFPVKLSHVRYIKQVTPLI